MSWPTGPPPMPPPGWYPDPEQAATWRWFDGLRWSELRAPMPMSPGQDPRSLSAWFERSMACVKFAARRVGPMIAAVWLVLGAALWWVAVSAFDGERGRELRRLLDLDRPTFGPAAGRAELTDAEAERAGELLRDLLVDAVPWLVALGLAGAIVWGWSTAAIARVTANHLEDAEDSALESRGAVARHSFARVPAVLLSGVVVVLAFVGLVVVASSPVVAVALAGGGGAAIVLTVVFALLLAFVVGAWLWGRLALASVIAAVGGHGLGVRRSWELTHGAFWFVVGRLVITALIAGAASGAVNVVVNGGFLLGIGLFVALFVLLHALASAVATLITTCAYLVIIDQVEAGDSTRRDHETHGIGSPAPYPYA